MLSGCSSSWQRLHTLTSCRSSPSHMDSAKSGRSFKCFTWCTISALRYLPFALQSWHS